MEKDNTALLVMDVQNAIVGMLEDKEKLINPLRQTIKEAHQHEIPVIYITVGFRKGYPEISPNNKSFDPIKNSDRNFDTIEAQAVYDEVAPQSGDIVVKKRRVSAFTGSDLEVVLRSQQINHLVLAGIATSGVVLSTVREAADKDYRLTVLSNCCADRDEEVHRVLINKIFSRQADVMSAGEWRQSLKNN